MLLASKEGRAEEANAIDETLLPLHKRFRYRYKSRNIFIIKQHDFAINLFRLFLESNPIPAKKALQLMGKIGYHNLLHSLRV